MTCASIIRPTPTHHPPIVLCAHRLADVFVLGDQLVDAVPHVLLDKDVHSHVDGLGDVHVLGHVLVVEHGLCHCLRISHVHEYELVVADVVDDGVRVADVYEDRLDFLLDDADKESRRDALADGDAVRHRVSDRILHRHAVERAAVPVRQCCRRGMHWHRRP